MNVYERLKWRQGKIDAYRQHLKSVIGTDPFGTLLMSASLDAFSKGLDEAIIDYESISEQRPHDSQQRLEGSGK